MPAANRIHPFRVSCVRLFVFGGPEVAPRLREMTDPQCPADFLRGHADPFGEGGERELEFGDLLDGHARGHRGGNSLDGLR